MRKRQTAALQGDLFEQRHCQAHHPHRRRPRRRRARHAAGAARLERRRVRKARRSAPEGLPGRSLDQSRPGRARPPRAAPGRRRRRGDAARGDDARPHGPLPRRPHRPAALRPRRQRSDLVGAPRRAQRDPARHRRSAPARRLHFDRGLADVDFDARIARFTDPRDGSTHEAAFVSLVGADGAGSALRAAMGTQTELGERTEFLGHSYKELEIPPAPTAASASSPTRCTSGRAAATCASPCPTTSAPSPSRCSCRTKATRASPPCATAPRHARCSSATSPTPCR